VREATHQLILEGRVTDFLRGRSPLPVVPVAVAHGGGASGMVTTLPPLRVITKVRCPARYPGHQCWRQ